uniref:EGF-like domain-containing protein n=1 Tax=Phytophthora ramorum TaxID=164328 RepID=H3GRI8_PHYRM
MTLRLLLVSVFLLLDVVQAACARGVYNSKICSGHGRCNTHNLCECDARHFGFDCSQSASFLAVCWLVTVERCPLGPAWVAPARATDDAHYLVECSNKGVCDYEEGTCRCDEGFVGSACQRRTCGLVAGLSRCEVVPASDAVKCSSGCNSAGQCLSLKELSATYAVGTEPLYDTAWDATMIYGCKCRKGYHGYDCSLKSCPRGDDPLTTGQKNEMQIVQCTATGGSFYLFYNGQGASIPFDATQSDLDRILRTIKTLPAVKVTFGGTATTVCSSATANAVTIEFTYEFGPQPPIKVMGSLNGINSLTGGSVFAASAETGQCMCFTNPMPGYRSSDGYGNPGERGDCGCANDKNLYGGEIARRVSKSSGK